VFHLLAERYLDAQYAPEAVAERCGIPAETIRRIARELAAAAFDSKLSLPVAWTDTLGRRHDSMPGRPVAMHAMRGISAHSNGFHTCRALHVLQLLLGAVDAPGSFRYQPPYPRPIRRRTARARHAAPTASSTPRRWVSCMARRTCWWMRTASRAASTTRIRGAIRSPCTACCTR
jgi:anaerobic selenocysteine-containing dehydrogenase